MARSGNEILVGSEKSVLAAIMREPNIIFDIHDITLNDTDFSNRMLRQIYIGMLNVAKRMEEEQGAFAMDSIVLAEAIAQEFPTAYKDRTDQFQSTIKTISEFKTNNVTDHIRIIATESYKRKTIQHLSGMKDDLDGFNDPVSLIQHLESKTLNFTGSLFSDTSDVVNIGERYKEWIIELALRAKEGKIDIGFSSGFEHYDNAIGAGLEKGCVNVIAARPKRGKSYLALAIAMFVSDLGIPVLYLDTELSEEIQMTRMTAMESLVPVNMVKSGEFVFDDKSAVKIKGIIKKIEGRPLYYVSIAGWTAPQQVSTIRRWFSRVVGKDEDGQTRNALVVLDYLKLMNSTDKKSDSEWEALGYRMSLLKDLMAQQGGSMLAFAQQNRSGVERDDATTISGSDRIIWLCDSFSIWSLKSEEEINAQMQNIKEQPGNEDARDGFTNMKLTVAESRHGPGTGNGRYLGFYFDGKDPSINREEFCGIIIEKGIELPWSGGNG
ncbi:hypothetical protein KAR91_49850 [Candidatus Pacearchaeota archaeon]|nr:hypothetical protein [Candidatus Pacearchaeota archaeon]